MLKKAWSTACPDWKERIIGRKSLIPFPPLYQEPAEMALRIFKQLRLVDVPGEPMMGEVTREWVYDFVAAIFWRVRP